MNTQVIHWMNHSIKQAALGSSDQLRVGLVLTSDNQELIASAFSGEQNGSAWISVIKRKLKGLNSLKIGNAYCTINTRSSSQLFDLEDLLRTLPVRNLYLGLPDPELSSYVSSDPVMTHSRVYRYPDSLQRTILEQNKRFFETSTQSINRSPYYANNRISDLVIRVLTASGTPVSKDELNLHKSRVDLAVFLQKKYGLCYNDAISIVDSALSTAFNVKYGSYDYSCDTRSIESSWKTDFLAFYNKLTSKPLCKSRIVSVGVGGGHEALSLFKGCEHITFVDIAPDGLKKIHRDLPSSRIVVSCATDLSDIPDQSQELYVSLRTYNSSFFDIRRALSEAKRVLISGGLLVISVANGFLCPERKSILPGLIIPGTRFIDIYRGLDTTRFLREELTQQGFRNIQICPTKTEIYLSANMPSG